MGASDLAIALAILLAASWLLVRSIRRGQGKCHGCSGGCRGASQSQKRPLVQLGPRR